MLEWSADVVVSGNSTQHIFSYGDQFVIVLWRAFRKKCISMDIEWCFIKRLTGVSNIFIGRNRVKQNYLWTQMCDSIEMDLLWYKNTVFKRVCCFAHTQKMDTWIDLECLGQRSHILICAGPLIKVNRKSQLLFLNGLGTSQSWRFMVDIEKDLKSESINRKWVKYGLERSVFKFPLKLDIHDPRKMDSVHNTKTRDFGMINVCVFIICGPKYPC